MKMCWSGEASAVMAVIGFTGALLEYRKMKKNKEGYTDKYCLRGTVLFYFSLMELLQAFNYAVLDTPGDLNSLFALLGYIHIAFQPFFVVWFYLSFLPKKRRQYWFKYANLFAVIACIMFLLGLIIDPSLPGCLSVYCTPQTNLGGMWRFDDLSIGCSDTSFSSYRGEWHIAWLWVTNSCNYLRIGYFFVQFGLPFFWGTYRIAIYCFIFGPLLAFFLTGDPNEWAAIWCLLSISFLSAVKIPVLERFFSVKYESWKDYFNS
jgi:Family of unknown function (DUF5765)